jgi:hypothetical protein
MDSDQDKPASGIPEWQRGADDGAPSNAADKPAEDQLQVARRFLEDDEVKGASREKKVAFLKAKGIEDGDIEKLLGETTSQDPVPDKVSSGSTLALQSQSQANRSNLLRPSKHPQQPPRHPLLPLPKSLHQKPPRHPPPTAHR